VGTRPTAGAARDTVAALSASDDENAVVRDEARTWLPTPLGSTKSDLVLSRGVGSHLRKLRDVVYGHAAYILGAGERLGPVLTSGDKTRG
jgi:hypothetical protein